MNTAFLLLQIIFWASIAGLGYIYFGYPMFVWAIARLRPAVPLKASIDATLSVVIVGFNEAHNLPRKLRCLLDSDCSDSILEIVFASDGSTDATESVARECKDPRFRLIPFTKRRGKPSVLNEVVPQCRGDIIVLADARQDIGKEALSELKNNFADKRIGVVSGELVFRMDDDSTTAARGIGAYWKYEKFIRRNESRCGSVPGATGALYAIRSALFRPIRPETLLDDVAIPMQAVTQGYRCIFEPNAIAYDRPCGSPDQEAIRKRRTIAGAAQLIAHYPGWLLPWRNPIWLQYVSHKIGRLFSPLLLLAAALSNAALVSHPFYRVVWSAHACFYIAAAVGWLLQNRGKRSNWFGIPLMFLTLNATAMAGTWDALRGRYQATWRRAV
jgi:poly-beta-1,6-N-acetyl-D-glucosamine synthase